MQTARKLLSRIFVLLSLAVLLCAFVACKMPSGGKTSGKGGYVTPSASASENGQEGGDQSSVEEPIVLRLTSDEDKIVDFSLGEPTALFSPSNGYKNPYPFNCTWRRNNVVFENGYMALKLTPNGGEWDGAEYRSRDKKGVRHYYGYGYYSVSMKAAKYSGVVSSFFTYNGNPWDEIDIEFLGKDTTKVQFNYYVNGEGGHECWYDLGFDAAHGYHEYGFDWQEDYIEWYVDGYAVHKATENIPSNDGLIMMNVWTGTGDQFVEWCGAFNGAYLPAAAQYKWIGFKAS